MKDETKILDKLLEYFKESNINDFGYEQDKLISYEEAQILLDYITNLQYKYDKALEDSVKETHKLMAIRKYLKDNEQEYGSLEDNEKIILGIIEGK